MEGYIRSLSRQRFELESKNRKKRRVTVIMNINIIRQLGNFAPTRRHDYENKKIKQNVLLDMELAEVYGPRSRHTATVTVGPILSIQVYLRAFGLLNWSHLCILWLSDPQLLS